MVAEKTVKTLWESHVPLPLIGRGKVRDIYAVGSDKLLIVASDRLSAFDYVLPNPIPFKGEVLTQISVFWFRFFDGFVKHHLITADLEQMGLPPKILSEHGDSLRGRSMLVKRTQPYLAECVARGYLAGSGWKDYLGTGSVCGHQLQKGLMQCEKLAAPLFTPATKAASGHDENISFKQMSEIVGEERARRLRDVSIELYRKGASYADGKGILVADTKFEFGSLGGEMLLIDEALTPDSSRFWPKDAYEPGRDQPSFDKQIVRNYLLEIGWNQLPPVPVLPEGVVQKTSDAYREIFRRLTGKEIGI